jgi:rhodanese-related sulfurtransferase
MWALLMGIRSIAPEELRSKIGDERVTIFDVNSRESWSDGHVPGARHLDPTNYSATDLPEDKDATVVFYCSNSMCRKAPIAAKRAKGMGYRNVRVMSVGIKGWRSKDLDTDPAPVVGTTGRESIPRP